MVADCIGMAASLSSFDVATCVEWCRFATGCCETHCHGCMHVAWAMFWGGSRSTRLRNLVFFRVKWLQPAMKGTSSVRRLRLGSFHARIVPPMCFATSGCSCVRSSLRFLNLWLQIALEWLLHCRHLMLPRA